MKGVVVVVRMVVMFNGCSNARDGISGRGEGYNSRESSF